MTDLEIIREIQTMLWGNSTTEPLYSLDAIDAIEDLLTENGYGRGDDEHN